MPNLKPSFSNRLVHQPSAPSLHQQQSTSARIVEFEKTLRALEDENDQMRTELTDLRALYKQLLTEGKHESFDERRVLLLKSQVIQLERQINLLTGALSTRASTLVEVENSISAVVDLCKSHQQSDSRKEVRLSVADVDRVVATLESARSRLFRAADVTSEESTSRPLVMIGDFVRNRSDGHSATLFDVCRGNIEHINLKRVGRLESRLVGVYKQLMLVNSALRTCVQSSTSTVGLCLSDVPRAVHSRLSGHVSKSCDMLEDVCSDLLQLSLLIPAAPLPGLAKPFLGEITADNILGSFRGGVKMRELRPLVEAMVRAMNYSINVSSGEKNVLLNELEFHRSVYEQQTIYVNSLSSALNSEYEKFDSDLRVRLCEPLVAIMASFRELKERLSNDSLLNFIAVFDRHTAVLTDTVNQLSAKTEVDGSVQHDLLFATYKKSLVSVLETCRRNRDRLVDEIALAQSQLQEHTAELSHTVASLACKHDREQSSSKDAETKNSLEPTILSPMTSTRSTEVADCKCSDSRSRSNAELDVGQGEKTTSDSTNETRGEHKVTADKPRNGKVANKTAQPIPLEHDGKTRVLPPGVAQRKLSLKQNNDRGNVRSSTDRTGTLSFRSSSSVHLLNSATTTAELVQASVPFGNGVSRTQNYHPMSTTMSRSTSVQFADVSKMASSRDVDASRTSRTQRRRSLSRTSSVSSLGFVLTSDAT